jgi:hypothetical protein
VPGTYAYAHGSSFENAPSVFSFVSDARADSVCFVSSRKALTFSRTRRSSSRRSARRSPIVESVEHPEASVFSICSTRHTLSDTTDPRARLASSGALGVRRPASAGELGPAKSLSRVRSLSSDEGASEGSARARDRANDE